jgi:predicted transposase YbfD/YdcC
VGLQRLVVDSAGRWAGLQSVIKITSARNWGKITTQECYYISSLSPDKLFNRYIRVHWGVENSLHWTLDMIFREDEQRKRDQRAAENFATVRKITLNLLKKDTTTRASLISKRLKAA